MGFKEKLKELRESKKIYQKELAREFCVKAATVSAWETGKGEPDTETLKKLAEYFCVSVDYLLGFETEDGRVVIQGADLSTDEKRLIETYRKLPEELKKLCLDYADTMRELNKNDYRR